MPREKSQETLDREDIENRFSFHPATTTTGPQHDAVRADLKRMALKLHKTLPPGRHRSLALTSLEETMHWANAAIACATPLQGGHSLGELFADPASKPKPAKKGAAARKTARRVTRTARS